MTPYSTSGTALPIEVARDRDSFVAAISATRTGPSRAECETVLNDLICWSQQHPAIVFTPRADDRKQCFVTYSLPDGNTFWQAYPHGADGALVRDRVRPAPRTGSGCSPGTVRRDVYATRTEDRHAPDAGVWGHRFSSESGGGLGTARPRLSLGRGHNRMNWLMPVVQGPPKRGSVSSASKSECHRASSRAKFVSNSVGCVGSALGEALAARCVPYGNVPPPSFSSASLPRSCRRR